MVWFALHRCVPLRCQSDVFACRVLGCVMSGKKIQDGGADLDAVLKNVCLDVVCWIC